MMRLACIKDCYRVGVCMDWFYTVSGFVVGFIVSVAGVGGGSLIGSLPGVWLGSYLGAKIPDRILRPV